MARLQFRRGINHALCVAIVAQLGCNDDVAPTEEVADTETNGTDGVGDGDGDGGDGDGDDGDGDGDDGDGDGDDGDGDGDDGDGDGQCAHSLSPTQDLIASQGNQLNPGRALGELSDQRGLAMHHFYGNATIDAVIFDPVAQTWAPPVVLRQAGPWEEEQHTRMEVRATPTGGVVFEDANGDVIAHRLERDQWSQAELPDDVPNQRYILDVQPSPDGRFAVLVQSEVGWSTSAALYLAYYDPQSETWSANPHLLLDDPQLQLEAAHILFDSEDGDALVTFVASPHEANWPRTGQVHHYDAQSQAWSLLYTHTGYVAWINARELELGQFAVSTFISGEEQTYFFSEDNGLGDPTPAPFPDEYLDGTMYRTWFGSDNTVNFDVYSQDDPIGTTDTLDLFVPDAPIDLWSTRRLVSGGRGYAMWPRFRDGQFSVEIAMHTDSAWSDPVALGEHTHPIGTMALVVNTTGDVVAAWSPGNCSGPCWDDPAMLARYDAATDCWSEASLDPGLWDPWLLPFSFTRNVTVTTVGPSAFGSIVSW